MDDGQPFSKWIIRLVIAAIFSILGFLAKDKYVDWKAKKAKKEVKLEQLLILSNLLNESKSIYVNQNFMSQRLIKVLVENHPNKIPQADGYDETFYLMYKHFQPEEAELQAIIRSTTMNSMRRVNQEMSDWLNADKVFKSKSQPTKEREALGEQLRTLELHLNEWHSKYEAIIPGNIERSLVYLVDEKNHGTGFPTGIDQVVEKVLNPWP